MTSITKQRIRINSLSETVFLGGRRVILVPPNARVGAFSKILTKVKETPEQALRAALELPLDLSHSRHDRLVCRSNGGWQVFAKRLNPIGPKNREEYDFTLDGQRAKRRATTTARLYYQPQTS